MARHDGLEARCRIQLGANLSAFKSQVGTARNARAPIDCVIFLLISSWALPSHYVITCAKKAKRTVYDKAVYDKLS